MTVVFEDHVKLAAIDAAGGIYLFDCHLGAIASGEADIGGRSGNRSKCADGDLIVGNTLFGRGRPGCREHSGNGENKPVSASHVPPLRSFFLTERSVVVQSIVTACELPRSR